MAGYLRFSQVDHPIPSLYHSPLRMTQIECRRTRRNAFTALSPFFHYLFNAFLHSVTHQCIYLFFGRLWPSPEEMKMDNLERKRRRKEKQIGKWSKGQRSLSADRRRTSQGRGEGKANVWNEKKLWERKGKDGKMNWSWGILNFWRKFVVVADCFCHFVSECVIKRDKKWEIKPVEGRGTDKQTKRLRLTEEEEDRRNPNDKIRDKMVCLVVDRSIP